MNESFEHFVQSTAQDLVYPPLPAQKISYNTSFNQQILARVAIAILVIGLAGFAVPDIRAKVLDFLNIGAVTITLDSVGADGEVLRLEDVAGETDLASAQAQVDFDIRLPPDNQPDRIYVQNESLVIFIWLDGNEIEQALYQIWDNDWGIYKTAETVTETTVNDETALWLNAHHPVTFVNGETEMTYFVQGNVLIWEADSVTYRLETHLDMETAIEFAEALEAHND